MWNAGNCVGWGEISPQEKNMKKSVFFLFFSVSISPKEVNRFVGIFGICQNSQNTNYWNDLMVSLLNMQVIQDEHTLKRWSYSSVSVGTTLPSQHFEKPHTPPKFNIAVLGAGDCIFTSQLFWYVKLRGWRCWIFLPFSNTRKISHNKKKDQPGSCCKMHFLRNCHQKAQPCMLIVPGIDGSFVCGG